MNTKISIEKIFSIIVFIMFFICYLSFVFGDLIYTSMQSWHVLDLLFKGNKSLYVFESPFYIPYHFVFSVWNLPLWIISCFESKLTYDSTISILWAKLLPILAFFISILIIKKIMFEIGLESEKISIWISIYITSLFVLFPIFVMCQYDIIGLVFFLLALYKIIKENRFSFKSLLLLSFSVSFKLLSLFSAVSLLLLKSKNIKDLFKNMMLLMFAPAFFIVFGRILINDIGIGNIGDMTSNFFEGLLNSIIEGGNFNISIVFMLLTLLYSYSFIRNKDENKKEFMHSFSWTCVCIYFTLAFFAAPYHPQWYIFPIIFMMFLFSSADDCSFNEFPLFFEIIEILLMLCNAIYFYWACLNENLFNSLLFKNLNYHVLAIDNHINLTQTIYLYCNAHKLAIIPWSIAFACVLVVIVGYYPDKTSFIKKEHTNYNNLNLLKWIRLAAMFLYIALEFSFRFLI